MRILLLPVLLLIADPLWAANASLLVGLQIQTTRLDLDYAGSIRQTDINSLNLLWHEPLNSWLEGSVKLGFIDLTQSSNPITAGQSTNGNSLGVGLQFYLYRGKRLDLHADLAYQYTDTSAELAGQTVDMRWHQVSGLVQADFRFLHYSYLTFAAGAVAIDGDEYATGTMNSLQTFRSHTPGFGRMGVFIGVDPASQIGIEVSGGAIAGGRLYFQRWF